MLVWNRYLAVTVVVLSSLVIAAGCGGGSDNEGDASSDAKTAFVRQANAICIKRGHEIRTNGEPFVKKSGTTRAQETIATKELVKYVVIPVFEEEIQEVGTLKPPPGDEDQIEAFLTATQEVIDGLKKNPMARGPYPYRRSEDLAAAYGMTACGHP